VATEYSGPPDCTIPCSVDQSSPAGGPFPDCVVSTHILMQKVYAQKKCDSSASYLFKVRWFYQSRQLQRKYSQSIVVECMSQTVRRNQQLINRINRL
jgi:hypothetical protein